jgi:hypothetical protein
MRSFGSAVGIALGLAVLVIESVIPMVIATQVFRRRDW